ncbi:cell filamentation protein Fic [Prevotella sp. P3-120]|uniref:Fic family protein n=1 Tax=unclassified Prevotella TaxID=2638335 RepID=UPI000B96345F|nr:MULTISPECIES: Fic family protein [unclassified Prevotella]OYP47854.1 cell filamentation protein Fic [Prevotella sp. P3-120]OYP53021.1 cell filamentation protein Fic [Prevotella sp. P3-92]
MTKENKEMLLSLIQQHKELGISEQIDYEKFYLYSIITHSTAIEGSTVTELEAQLLFDEGITSQKRTLVEQLMNLDLKTAYDYGMKWIKHHEAITVNWLITLASKVMARTGSEYHSLGGDFSAAKGELRKLNVTAGFGGKSYMSYLKVPSRLEAFCEELNKRRMAIDKTDIAAIYELSFWAHFELVSIHPWADGNGRTCRLLMNLLQIEYGVLPTKVLREDKAEYIQALIDTRENEDIQIFLDCMTQLHCKHLKWDIDQFIKSMTEEMVDKIDFAEEMVDKWSIKPALAKKLADILIFADGKDEITTEIITKQFNLTQTTAKRYLRQLTEFGYIEAQGGNKNRTYKKK